MKPDCLVMKLFEHSAWDSLGGRNTKTRMEEKKSVHVWAPCGVKSIPKQHGESWQTKQINLHLFSFCFVNMSGYGWEEMTTWMSHFKIHVRDTVCEKDILWSEWLYKRHNTVSDSGFCYLLSCTWLVYLKLNSAIFFLK